MAVFMARGYKDAFHRNVSRSLATYFSPETRSDLRRLITTHADNQHSELLKNLENETVTAWGAKSEKAHDRELFEQLQAGDYFVMRTGQPTVVRYVQQVDYTLGAETDLDLREALSERIWGSPDYDLLWFSTTPVLEIDLPEEEFEDLIRDVYPNFEMKDWFVNQGRNFTRINTDIVDHYGGDEEFITTLGEWDGELRTPGTDNYFLLNSALTESDVRSEHQFDFKQTATDASSEVLAAENDARLLIHDGTELFALGRLGNIEGTRRDGSLHKQLIILDYREFDPLPLEDAFDSYPGVNTSQQPVTDSFEFPNILEIEPRAYTAVYNQAQFDDPTERIAPPNSSEDDEVVTNQHSAALSDGSRTQPAVWIEKTEIEGRTYKKEGDLQLGNAIYSPSQDKQGGDRYATMREAAVGDIVLHLLQDKQQIVGVSQIESQLETDFEGLPEFGWTSAQEGYRRWLTNYVELADPINIYDDVLDNTTYTQELHQIREAYEKIFFDRNLGLVQGGYFTQCPPELLEILLRESTDLPEKLREREYPLDSLPSRNTDPADAYDGITEATADIQQRIEQTPGQANWLANQLSETIVRDWSEALRGLGPNTSVTVECATKLRQIKRLYEESTERLTTQTTELGSGTLNALSEPETLFVVLLRDLQEQVGLQANANQVKIKNTLYEEYKVEQPTNAPGEDTDRDTTDDPRETPPTQADLAAHDHPLVSQALREDVSVYKFTAPPDYWLTVFEYTALSFEPSDKQTWEEITAGDVVLFHSRQDPSWDELSTQESGLIGAGIARKKTRKPDAEAWWYDEYEGGPKGDSFPYLLTFERLFATGDLDAIDFTTSITDKDPHQADTELESLTTDSLSFEEADDICRRVSGSGFPRYQTVSRFDSTEVPSRAISLLDALAPDTSEVPSVALYKKFSGTIDQDVLAGLYFPNERGEEIIAQIETALRTGKHIILTGPPGTGKTEIAQRICTQLAQEYPYLFSGSQLTTATADWSTFDTVGGYMPNADDTTHTNSLEFSPGLLLNRFKHRRAGTQLNEPLVIDELNRADIDKAFGQLFTVLSGQAVQLPYTRNGNEVELTPAASKRKNGRPADLPQPHEYVIPESWPLFATLNTYDKTSLYEMSYAFMRRFTFIRVPAPDLPADETELLEIMNEYASVWDLGPGDNQTELTDVGLVWRATNDAVEDRSIGPAVVKDILEYVIHHTTATPSTRLTQAVISFIFPQLEGVPKRERIIREIAAVERTDEAALDQAARDMLQVSITSDE